MSRRRQLSEDERALWTGFARSIRPLQGRQAPAEPPVPASNEAADAANDETAPPDPPPAPAARPDPPPQKASAPLVPLGRRLRQRVARGRESIDARIDLHGMTQSRAHAALLRFLRQAQADDVRIALVVTGKGAARADGHHGGERGVLKRQVPLWLALPEFRSLVVGFEDAHIGHGGQGALYVRLRRAQRTDR
jgi:DNA-nicking Smr family endonuclease